MKKTFYVSFFLLIFIFSWVSSDAQTNIYYVKVGGSGNQNGISWDNAFSSIRQAIDSASIQQPKADVWVASGSYYGDGIEYHNAFEVIEGVDVYGSFVGNEFFDYDLSQRDFEANATILDGQDVQRVLYQSTNFTDTTIWDGFIIKNGDSRSFANFPHGGGVVLRGNAILQNSIIRNNYSSHYGGGIYMSGNGLLLHSTVEDNRSSLRGGGIHLEDSNYVFNCLIQQNHSNSSGGGVSIQTNGIVDSCRIYENEVFYNGGGAVLYSDKSVLKRSIIAGNKTIARDGDEAGGGVYLFAGTVSTCNIHNNKTSGLNGEDSESRGGGAYIGQEENTTSPLIINCVIANNTSANSGGGVFILNGGDIINCTVVNNKSLSNSDMGGGIYCYGGDSSRIINTIIWKNYNSEMISNIRMNYNFGIYSDIAYSAIENGYYGTHNIILDNENNQIFGPCFIEPSSDLGCNDDYTSYSANWNISENSICINAGTEDTSVLHLPSVDVAGNARLQYNRIDIGAYETPYDLFTPNILPDSFNILYVTETGTGNGSSWSDALSDIQLALDYIDNYDLENSCRIWVAAGTYYGDADGGNMAFYIRDGVHLYGSFSGNEVVTSESDIEIFQNSRNFEDNPSALDGGHSQRVLYQLTIHSKILVSLWDGFTIQNGNLMESAQNNGNGAGAKVGNNLIFRNCTFKDNHTDNHGGGLYIFGNTRVENCFFYNNSASNGGGGLYSSGGFISNSLFTLNESPKGGGIYLQDSGTVIKCTLSNNQSGFSGGGIFLENGGVVNNCLIANNIGTVKGGGGVRMNKGGTLIGNTIVHNYSGANAQGAGILSEGGIIKNCIIWGNKRGTTSSQIFIIFNTDIYRTELNHCAIEDGWIGETNIFLSSINNGSGYHHPNFVQPTSKAGLLTEEEDGDWHLTDGSICINRGTTDSTGLYLPDTDLSGNQRIQNDTIDIGAYESPWFSSTIPSISESGIIYVVEGGRGNMDGSSWNNALATIQDAIDIVFMQDSVEIWVAAGTYYSSLDRSMLSDSSKTPLKDSIAQDDYNVNAHGITMLPGVKVYGGFNGSESEDFDIRSRDFDANPTYIDGENQNRLLFQGTAFPIDNPSLFDGFHLVNGKAKVAGGAVYLQKNGHIVNCIINNNVSDSMGGGVYFYGGGDLKNCILYNNKAKLGGGIFVNYQDEYISQADSIINCLIHHNTAEISGGGIYHHNFNDIENNLIVSNVTIVENTCGESGGGFFSGKGIHLYNSIIWGNNNAQGRNQIHWSDPTNIINYCAVENETLPQSPTNISLSSDNNGYLPNEKYPRFYNLFSNDYRLHDASSCFNAGCNDYVFNDFDCNYSERIMFNTVDMGAYETVDTGFCANIYYLQVDSVKNTTAWLSWLSDGDHFRYEVSISNMMNVTPVIKESPVKNITLNNLSPNTEYLVSIRGKCITDGPPYTTYSIPVKFRTTCDTTSFTHTLDTTICEGTVLVWRGNIIQNLDPGTYQYRDSLKTICDADSIYILNIIIAGTPEPPQTDLIVNTCGNSSVLLTAIPGNYGNQCRWYQDPTAPIVIAETTEFLTEIINVNESRNYWVSSYNDTTNCESERLRITVNAHPVYDETFDLSVCDSLFWIDTLITTAGSYTKTLSSFYECDSTVTLNVTINESPTLTLTGDMPVLEACVNQPITPFSFIMGGSADSVIFTNLPDGLQIDFFNDTVVISGTPTINDQFEASIITVGQSEPCEAISYSSVFSVFDCDVPFYGKKHVCINSIESCSTKKEQTNYVWTVEGGEILYGQNTDSIVIQWTTLGQGSITISFDGVIPVSYDILIHNTESSEFDTTACTVHRWNDSTYTESGDYTQNLSTIYGCDSSVTMHLTINEPVTFAFDTIVCDSMVWNNIRYLITGSFLQTFEAANGCDSIVTMNLIVNRSITYPVEETACDSIVWNGEVYTETGDYTQHLERKNGCDSTVIKHLTILSIAHHIDTTICDSLQWNDSTYTEAGLHIQSFPLPNGCDSTVYLNLTLLYSYTNSYYTTVCDSMVWNNATYTENGTYTQTFTSSNGCDSTITIHLTVFNSITTELDSITCDTLLWNDSVYTESTIISQTFETVDGCDSIVSINLTIVSSYFIEEVKNVCSQSFEWHGRTLTESGIYWDSTTTTFGCDSIFKLNLSIFTSSIDTLYETRCQGDTLFWINDTLTVSGVYTDTLHSVVGCDSIFVLYFTVQRSDSTLLFDSLCHGENYFENGFELTAGMINQLMQTSGSDTIHHQQSKTNVFGCDSLILLTLHVQARDSLFLNGSICEGEEYIIQDDTLTTTGTFYIPIPAQNGCDSIIVLSLQVHPLSHVIFSDSICEGDSLLFDGIYRTSAGVYEATFPSIPYGCDSTVELTLSFYPHTTPVINSETSIICAGDSITLSVNTGVEFLWNTGNTTSSIIVSPTTETQYSVTVIDENGCHSEAQKSIAVYPPITPTLSGTFDICIDESATITLNNGGVSQLWNTGETTTSITVYPTQTSTYSVTTIDANGCEYTLQATINVHQPAIPTEVTAVNFQNRILLVWLGVGEAFQIYRDDGFSEIVSGNSYEDTHIEYDVIYCYYVESINFGCHSLPSNSSCMMISLPCQAPTNLSAVRNINATHEWVSLEWDEAENSSYYIIYADHNDEIIATTTNNYYNDTIYNYHGMRCYYVKSFCINGQTSIPSNTSCAIVDDVQEEQKDDFKIFPNPAHRQVTIAGDDMAEIAIYNSTGQMIQRQTMLNEPEQTLDIRFFETGLYIFKIITNKGIVFTKRIIVVH